MATHDYNIANGTGQAVRNDLNNALAAIVSNNSSSTEPSTTFAFQWWADTNNTLLKIRNAANSAWVTVGDYSTANLGLVTTATANSTYLALAGGTVTGALEIGTAGSLVFEGATANDFETTLAVTDPTADRTITLPNATGTVALLSLAQTFTAAQRGSITALTDGATITPDFAVANNFSVTLGGNRTLANPSNLTAGQSGSILSRKTARAVERLRMDPSGTLRAELRLLCPRLHRRLIVLITSSAPPAPSTPSSPLTTHEPDR